MLVDIIVGFSNLETLLESHKHYIWYLGGLDSIGLSLNANNTRKQHAINSKHS